MRTTTGLADPRGIALSVVAVLALYAVQRDWRVALAGGIAVLAVKLGARAVVTRSAKRPPLPALPLPQLTQDEALVAFGIWRGWRDEEIAEHLGISAQRTALRVKQIAAKWRTPSRTAIRHHVIEIVGEPPHEKEPWEWVAELGLGLAVATLGLTVLLAASDTPVIGPVRDWTGLGLIGLGVGFCVSSSVGYFAEHTR